MPNILSKSVSEGDFFIWLLKELQAFLSIESNLKTYLEDLEAEEAEAGPDGILCTSCGITSFGIGAARDIEGIDIASDGE